MLPEAFTERMQKMLGEEYEAFLETFEEERYQALRLNPLKIGMDGCSAAERYGLDAADSERVPWAENGYYYTAEERPGKHPYHEAGLYYIQEPSAMAPAELLGVKPGERVLDLCAAPGGKSTQIGAKLLGKGILVCNEIHPARAKILSENMERMGIANSCVMSEAPERLVRFFGGFFDRILVDAPCSGEGMFRKNEEAYREWSPENIALCAERQDRILDSAACMLRPGGTLVYSTCTFAPEENEGSVSRFLRRHGAFSIRSVEKELLGLAGCDGSAAYLARVKPEAEQALPGMEAAVRLLPQRVRGEGHFAVLLQKDGGMPGSPVSGDGNAVGCNTEKRREDAAEPGMSERRMETKAAESNMGRGCGEKYRAETSTCGNRGSSRRSGKARKENSCCSEMELESIAVFTSENIRLCNHAPETGDQDLFQEIGQVLGMGREVRPVRFGEQIYLVPEQLPLLNGLKVLRPGMHLGELKKNRFEPSHGLAMALCPIYAVHVWNLDARDPLVTAYLKGQTFPAAGERGWYLICVDGFSIGWGKLAGGIMKNHYPIGLRRKDFREDGRKAE